MLTFFYEIGHALGLGHSGVYNCAGNPVLLTPPFENDSWQASIMSYFSQDEKANRDAGYAIAVTLTAAKREGRADGGDRGRVGLGAGDVLVT